MNVKLVVTLVLAGLVVLFVVQNVAVVEIQFLLWSISMSRAILMFALMAIGIVIGWLLHSYALHRSKQDREKPYPKP